MAHARRFRFGVTVVSDLGAAIEWRALARRSEELGYSSLLISDHFVEMYTPSIVDLAFLAAFTDKLRLGTLVLGNDYRHPAVLAKDAAKLDVLSGGRLELGLGAGWMRSDYEALGFPYDSPSTRIARLDEALTIVKQAFSGKRFNFQGEHYTISEYAARPVSLQKPHPPIIVGGGSPRILRLAGREADIVGIHVSIPTGELADVPVKDTLESQTRRKVEWVREGAGERFAALELQMVCSFTVTGDRRGAAAPLAAQAGVSVDELLASGMTLIGSVDEICAELERRRAEWGVSYIVVPVEQIEQVAPVVARIAGT